VIVPPAISSQSREALKAVKVELSLERRELALFEESMVEELSDVRVSLMHATYRGKILVAKCSGLCIANPLP